MFYLPTRRPIRVRIARRARQVALTAAIRLVDRIEAVASNTTTVQAEAVAVAETTPATVPALFAEADMPPVEAIEAAADVYDQAADLGRQADRGKRKARKLLDRLPAGIYGRAVVERVVSARQTPDLDQIRLDYARAGLGEVPMKACAPTLKVTLAPAVEGTRPAVVVVAA